MAQRPSRCRAGSRQLDLFPRSKRPTIPLADDHPLVVLTDTVNWTEMEARAQQIRSKKRRLGVVRGRGTRDPFRAFSVLRLTLGAPDSTIPGVGWLVVAHAEPKPLRH